jgi:hypothetical protein
MRRGRRVRRGAGCSREPPWLLGCGDRMGAVWARRETAVRAGSGVFSGRAAGTAAYWEAACAEC